MEDFSSEDYLFLTHLGDYTESIISESQVRELVDTFPGEVYLANEFPREQEDFEKEVFGQDILPEENYLQTVVGLGEPETMPEEAPETAYFGGFTLTWCMANTAKAAHEKYGDQTDYAILADYTINSGIETLQESIDNEHNVETVDDLEELGYVKEGDLDHYPETCRVTSSNPGNHH